MRRFRRCALALGALALIGATVAPLAAADELPASDPRPAGIQQVDLEVLASIRFAQDVYTVAKPGKVCITLGGVPGMAITIRERPRVELATPGPPRSAVAKLRRGTYHIESAIPGHTKAGIHALLVVG